MKRQQERSQSSQRFRGMNQQQRIREDSVPIGLQLFRNMNKMFQERAIENQRENQQMQPLNLYRDIAESVGDYYVSEFSQKQKLQQQKPRKVTPNKSESKSHKRSSSMKQKKNTEYQRQPQKNKKISYQRRSSANLFQNHIKDQQQYERKKLQKYERKKREEQLSQKQQKRIQDQEFRRSIQEIKLAQIQIKNLVGKRQEQQKRFQQQKQAKQKHKMVMAQLENQRQKFKLVKNAVKIKQEQEKRRKAEEEAIKQEIEQRKRLHNLALIHIQEESKIIDAMRIDQQLDNIKIHQVRMYGSQAFAPVNNSDDSNSQNSSDEEQSSPIKRQNFFREQERQRIPFVQSRLIEGNNRLSQSVIVRSNQNVNQNITNSQQPNLSNKNLISRPQNIEQERSQPQYIKKIIFDRNQERISIIHQPIPVVLEAMQRQNKQEEIMNKDIIKNGTDQENHEKQIQPQRQEQKTQERQMSPQRQIRIKRDKIGKISSNRIFENSPSKKIQFQQRQRQNIENAQIQPQNHQLQQKLIIQKRQQIQKRQLRQRQIPIIQPNQERQIQPVQPQQIAPQDSPLLNNNSQQNRVLRNYLNQEQNSQNRPIRIQQPVQLNRLSEIVDSSIHQAQPQNQQNQQNQQNPQIAQQQQFERPSQSILRQNNQPCINQQNRNINQNNENQQNQQSQQQYAPPIYHIINSATNTDYNHINIKELHLEKLSVDEVEIKSLVDKKVPNPVPITNKYNILITVVVLICFIVIFATHFILLSNSNNPNEVYYRDTQYFMNMQKEIERELKEKYDKQVAVNGGKAKQPMPRVGLEVIQKQVNLLKSDIENTRKIGSVDQIIDWNYEIQRPILYSTQ